MKRNRLTARLLRSSILTGALVAIAAPAYAQNDADDTIVVTGSRIAKRDATSDSPIFTVDAEAFQQSGSTTVEHYLNTLPQVVAGLTSQSNNPSSNGRAFIDLRGLGSNRNLVLMDGRRGMGSTAGGVVDVNTIPAALIERVEVITGGAAATYGADAVSGVVNFIMKKNFDGWALDGQYRITERGDGQEWGTDLTYGSQFADGRGSAVFNVSYFKRDDMYKGARDFSAQASSTTGIFPNGSYNTGTNQPSAAAVAGIFGPGLCQTTGGSAGFGINPNGTLFCTGTLNNSTFNVVGYTGPQSDIATQFFPDQFSYNFEPDNLLVLPMERLSFYAGFDLDLQSWFKPYATAMFTNYNALQELAPTPGGGFTVPVTNPFIPAQLKTLLASRPNPNADFSFSKRFNALGGRTGYNTHDVWQVTTGAKGDIVGSWGYDVYLSYGRSVQNEIQGGNVQVQRFEALLDSPSGGANLCAGGFNPFGNNPVSQACIDYVNLNAKNLTVVEQVILEGVTTGSLFSLPAGEVQVALGASYRWLDFDFAPDSGLQPGLVVGFNGQLPISGYNDWTDFFGEISIPVVRDLPFAQLFEINAGYRTTDNSGSGTADSWKAMGNWTVNEWLRLRGGYQHAVRSPSISELFAPQVPSFPNIAGQDPCNTGGPISTTAIGRNGPNGAQIQALCAAQAAVAGAAVFSQPFGQAEAIVGGNPNLKPEISDSWTVGMVARVPTDNPWLERASLTVDYWSIKLEDTIGALGAITILQRCFNLQGVNPTYSPANPYCQLFERAPADGRVDEMKQFNGNIGASHTAGLDVALNWGFGLDQLGMGSNSGDLGFSVTGTWWHKAKSRTTVTPLDPENDFVGSIGAGTASATPEFKFTVMTTYSRDDLQLQLATRFIDAMVHANTITGAVGTGTPSTWYLDFSGRYNLTDNVTLRAGVNNLLDQEPRLYNPNIQANTDPSTYDVLGRRYFFGVNVAM